MAMRIDQCAKRNPDLITLSPPRGGYRFPEPYHYFYAELTEKGKEVLKEI
jgi:hypothetical protein